MEGEEHSVGANAIIDREKKMALSLSEDFNQALLSISGKILDEDFTLQKFQNRWRLLPKKVVASNTRATFYERLFENLIIRWRDKGVFRLTKFI
ncbi:MAG: hypothetical protein U5K71_10685 [Gracilimonas sp.]|nr:hypothetical protein [Gracilimonas sp.]